MDFVDRFLKCSDCGNDFIFTAGEQLFFLDRQFKNDPKRCKLCKAKRAGLGRTAEGAAAAAALPLSRTETRTRCSECGIDTTVPFKPTQGRPVFCRSCFQIKRLPTAITIVAELDSPLLPTEQAIAGVLNVAGPDSQVSMAATTMESIAGTPAMAIARTDAGWPAMERITSEVG